jgi:succinate-semialdehyde dehydrogenase/glutarate-semialdehyde dehydrogenase
MDQAHIGSEKLESGCVAVNTGVVALAEAPFGGIKQTGYGREGGSGAIKDYLNVKYTHMGLKYNNEKKQSKRNDESWETSY